MKKSELQQIIREEITSIARIDKTIELLKKGATSAAAEYLYSIKDQISQEEFISHITQFTHFGQQ